MAEATIIVRVNGIAHAFLRELGCPCKRCQTVNFDLAEANGKLEAFPGWPDPPLRANTSASLLIPDPQNPNRVLRHILIDAGRGVVDSLVASRLQGLEQLTGVLITHWHPDHIAGLNQLGEGLRRSAKSRDAAFTRVPLYCTQQTHAVLRRNAFYEMERFFVCQEITPGQSFTVVQSPEVCVTPVEVAHGKVEGAVVYVVQILGRKILFGWDIDTPDAHCPSDGRSNIRIMRDNLALLQDADLYFLPANTWQVVGTGHTTFLQARSYIDLITPKRVLLVHFSGHEDGPGNPGYGWSDAEWAAAVDPYGVEVAWQGMVLTL